MKAYMRNRFIRGTQLNRMVRVDWGSGLDGNEPGWCDRYLTTIQKRKAGVELALLRHWERGGQVLEYGFSGVKARGPGEGNDSLHSAESLADLLANRCQGFNLQLELVNCGPFPVCGSD